MVTKKPSNNLARTTIVKRKYPFHTQFYPYTLQNKIQIKAKIEQHIYYIYLCKF